MTALLLLPAVSGAAQESSTSSLSLPVVGGSVSLEHLPLFATTVLIAFVDGFNPCSLWVLSFLLGVVIHSGSRRKVAVVGVTFLSVTAAVYGAFIVGTLNVFSYIGYLSWIRLAVALVAGAVAALNIKDFFAFRRGPSLTISARRKPRFAERLRGIMQADRTGAALVGATAVMALGIALAELPCTAGFPIMWSAIISEHAIGGAGYGALLAAYLIVYLAIEIVIFLGAVVTLRMSRLEERQGRVLKLLGGTIMLLLAVAMIVRPQTMNSFGETVLLFGAAVVVTAATTVVDRRVRAKGIQKREVL